MVDTGVAPNLSELPPEMLEFTILKSAGVLTPRLGRLSLAGRKTLQTPAFIGHTSRGVIPHISQDNFRNGLDLDGVYVALEDCTMDPNAAFGKLLTPRSRRKTPTEDTTHLPI
jgi:queuine tRNA-ribosyltransferase subunit QTRTD1